MVHSVGSGVEGLYRLQITNEAREVAWECDYFYERDAVKELNRRYAYEEYEGHTFEIVNFTEKDEGEVMQSIKKIWRE